MIFFLVLSLGFGLGSIALTTQQFNFYKLNFIKYLLFFLISINIVAIISIFYNYFKEHLSELPFQYLGIGVEIAYRLFACGILVVIFGSMIFLLRALIGQKPSKQYIKSLLLIWTILMFIFFIGIKSMFEKNSLPIPILANVAIDQLGQYIILFEIIRSYYLSSSIKDLVNRSYTRKALLVLFLMWLSIILLSSLTLFGYLNNEVLNVSSAFIFIAFNAIPLIYLKPYLRNVYGEIMEDNVTIKSLENIDDLYKRYAISPREKDIIKLICQGYANKKIADELCISLHTVKDHNYRIFKKLNVQNRVQLTNMFKRL